MFVGIWQQKLLYYKGLSLSVMGGQWTEKCIYTAKQCAPQLCKNGPDWIEPWFVFWSVASF